MKCVVAVTNEERKVGGEVTCDGYVLVTWDEDDREYASSVHQSSNLNPEHLVRCITAAANALAQHSHPSGGGALIGRLVLNAIDVAIRERAIALGMDPLTGEEKKATPGET